MRNPINAALAQLINDTDRTGDTFVMHAYVDHGRGDVYITASSDEQRKLHIGADGSLSLSMDGGRTWADLPHA